MYFKLLAHSRRDLDYRYPESNFQNIATCNVYISVRCAQVSSLHLSPLQNLRYSERSLSQYTPSLLGARQLGNNTLHFSGIGTELA
jgi:hypothetical protein